MYTFCFTGVPYHDISGGYAVAGAAGVRHAGEAVGEHERVSSACSRLKGSAKEQDMKDIIKSSVVPGAAVAGLGFAAAAYGGPVVWACFWGAVLFAVSRA